ncbi:polyserase-2-like [Eucyclogobius newberryi]|uniref:polyserase-2-like n=1 Tax=Eucyclogobius newberryi TaxID=166745 RepID=UPI003B58E5A8
MSAAHCFSSTSAFGWQISLGRENLQGTNPNEVSKSVSKIILHPNYDSFTSDNDVALLRLSSAVTFSDYIRPVCLAATDSVFNSGTDSWVTGWGSIREGEPLPFPETLQEVEVPVVGNRQCNCLNGVGTITDNMICAGLLAGGKDSCQGDSGGPMVSKQGSVWVQSGVVSFGFGCARANLPGVYSRVSNYQSWINSHISSDQPGFVQFMSSGPDRDTSATCPGLPLQMSAILNSSPVRSSCGVAPSHPLRNENSNSQMWPWMVIIHKNGAYVCGGTLIADNFVLTSAECISHSNLNLRDWTVSFGHNENSSVGVVDIVVSGDSSGSSIALMKLATSVSYTSYIQPVCVDTSNITTFPVGSQCWISGFRVESRTTENKPTLRDMETHVSSCESVSDLGNICTSSMDVQQGDQGGALLCQSGSSWFQAAVVTVTGAKTLRSDIHVFARTSQFASFIRETVGDMSSASAVNTTASGGNSAGSSLGLLLLFSFPMLLFLY